MAGAIGRREKGLLVAQLYRVNLERFHTLEEKGEAKGAPVDFIGQHLGVFLHADGLQRPRQVFEVHTSVRKFPSQDKSSLSFPICNIRSQFFLPNFSS